ncbi:MAG TPA: molybdopterin-guanine dinucleotide biosynthesis protein B [Candidatus Saccharicenans sp.]|jgi:molybdopterin-guanine dinucleotide biosynthesis protein B|nr:molybdopterin-guanine dinucleotide biosynthesis protein B [Candidatus Saccharicenans sp.]HRD02106.1 molybdopterin-guanine dinucleotide biosynthesis protein B [Candidatus Saccharicenans sp.]
MKTVAIVGNSDSGKTRLITALIKELNSRALKCGVLKKASEEVELDKEGKDSWQFMAAGAEAATVLTPEKIFTIEKNKASQTLLDIALERFAEVDLLLVEGGKKESAFKKIWRLQKAADFDETKAPEELLALVADEPFPVSPRCPVFQAEDISKLADFLLTTLEPLEPLAELKVDGRAVPLNPFVQSLLTETIKGLLRALKGLPESPQRVEIKLKTGEKDEKPGRT